VQSNPALWSSTAIFITTDEGGCYYDSGYIQLLDFFGDGTRIPFIAVSHYAKSGYVDHTYYDHVSLLKFIEETGICRRSSIAAATICPIRSPATIMPMYR
jgi:phospholipase C